MADLCHDLVGVEPRKRKAEDLPEEQRALVERTGCAQRWGELAGHVAGMGCWRGAAPDAP